MHEKLLSVMLFGFAALPAAGRATEDGPAAATATVTVSAKKEAVVKKIDKTVYDVANLPRAANGSAQDVLQSTPGLSVTADGQVAVKGNTQVTVLVDGKPAAMLSGSAEERAVALQTMSGADIASVEVITNPSAAYAANGGAIVNVVLKRNRKPGAHAQAQGSAADHGLWNAGTSGDITRGGVSLHGSLALRHDGTRKVRASSVDWNNPRSDDPLSGLAGRNVQTSEVFVRRVVDSASFGIDDALGEQDTLSLSARHNARRSRPLFDVLNDVRTRSAETRAETLYHRISDGPNTQSDDSASLTYSRRGQDTAFKAMLQHSATRALVDKSYRDVYILPARQVGHDVDYSHAASRLARRLDQATLDWTRALEHGAQEDATRTQWGIGLDLQDKTDDIGNVQAWVDPLTGAQTPDPDTTNAYAVRTTIRAAYATWQFTHGRWEALLGGRLDRMALRVRPAATDAHWQAFNPSLHLKYALDDGTDLTFAYRRSLQMSDPRDLNPFTTYVDAQNLSRGNPHLQPQRTGSWEIGADARAPQLEGSLGAFYRGSRDTVTDARSVDGNVLVTSRQNGGQGRSSGVTASLEWTPAAALRLGVDGGVYDVTLDTPDLARRVRQSGVSGYANFTAAWTRGRDDVSLDAHVQAAGITPLGRQGATSSVNLAWKHALGRTLSLTVNASDLFDGSRRTYAVDTATFRQAGFDHFVARRIYVGFVEKFE